MKLAELIFKAGVYAGTIALFVGLVLAAGVSPE